MGEEDYSGRSDDVMTTTIMLPTHRVHVTMQYTYNTVQYQRPTICNISHRLINYIRKLVTELELKFFVQNHLRNMS